MSTEDLPLVVYPTAALQVMGQGGTRIVTEMVTGALELSRDASLMPRFRIGEHEFCEPDYRQIRLWAEALELEPEVLIERLLTEPKADNRKKHLTRFERGRIIKLGWDVELLPLGVFE